MIPERRWQGWLNPSGLRVGVVETSDKFRKLGLMGFDGLAPGASKFFAVNEDSTFFAQNQRVDAWDLMSFAVVGMIRHIIAVICRDELFHSPSFSLF